MMIEEVAAAERAFTDLATISACLSQRKPNSVRDADDLAFYRKQLGNMRAMLVELYGEVSCKILPLESKKKSKNDLTMTAQKL